MKCHVNKISRLISKKFDVNEHINNMSSYHLSLFENLSFTENWSFLYLKKFHPLKFKPALRKHIGE